MARDIYWDRIGSSDGELISYAINPELLGAPPWPGHQQSFRLVRTGDSLVIASEGLSDPYPETHEKGRQPNSGLGLEVLIELPGWQRRSIEEVHSSWAFAAVELFAQNVAGSHDFLDRLDAHGVMSMELPFDFELEGWTRSGRLGSLIDMPIAPDFKTIPGLPGKGARIVPFTVISSAELSACVAGGAEMRQLLTRDLVRGGYGHRVDLSRASLR